MQIKEKKRNDKSLGKELVYEFIRDGVEHDTHMHIMFLQNTYWCKKNVLGICLPMCLTKIEILKGLTRLIPKNVNSAILISCNGIHSHHTYYYAYKDVK